MPLLESDYTPKGLFLNPHFNTFYASNIRRPLALSYTRKKIETDDGDFLNIDLLKNGNRKAVVLCHGLEGGSDAGYIQGAAGKLHDSGYDILAMNLRFCNGEINRQLRTYHHGETEDLNTAINSIIEEYDEIFLVGFSLGGNIVLKYVGDGIYPIDPKIKAVVSISVLMDLDGGVSELAKFKNRFYNNFFLKKLKKKIKLKHKQHPSKINLEKLHKVKTLVDFDEYITCAVYGYESLQDYYSKCNSKQFLNQITIPTLIINSLDDPFLSKSCYPFKEAEENPSLFLMTPKYGGHVGYSGVGDSYLWSERKILDFIQRG
ncbi:MAG: alpha/beta fold hydrolase [Flavobacteriales bacterium]|nr:alpha/beta fold hydrolase [Flavobacteriales bacterium]